MTPPLRPRSLPATNAYWSVLPNKSYNMKQEMLINVAQPEECRIAIVEDGSSKNCMSNGPDRTIT